MDMQTPEENPVLAALAKGILVGGSVGVLLSFLFSMELERSLALGLVCGFLAAFTRIRKQGK